MQPDQILAVNLNAEQAQAISNALGQLPCAQYATVFLVFQQAAQAAVNVVSIEETEKKTNPQPQS